MIDTVRSADRQKFPGVRLFRTEQSTLDILDIFLTAITAHENDPSTLVRPSEAKSFLQSPRLLVLVTAICFKNCFSDVSKEFAFVYATPQPTLVLGLLWKPTAVRS